MNILKIENLISQIYLIRGERILLDYDLAILYQEDTRKLKQAVRRNINRFPDDFMFQLTREEYDFLIKTHSGLLRRGQHTHLPFAFTEQGVAMLSSVLNSDRAIQVNIAIMRTFVQMRKFIQDNKELNAKVQELETVMEERFAQHDTKIKAILDVIKRLIQDDPKPGPQVGFHLN